MDVDTLVKAYLPQGVILEICRDAEEHEKDLGSEDIISQQIAFVPYRQIRDITMGIYRG